MLKETPWDFAGNYEFDTDNGQKVILKYIDLNEVNQGSPLKGKIIIQANNEVLKPKGDFGGPPLKLEHQDLILIPKWNGSQQTILLFNPTIRSLKILSYQFDLIQFERVEGNTILIIDGSIYKSKQVRLRIGEDF